MSEGRAGARTRAGVAGERGRAGRGAARGEQVAAAARASARAPRERPPLDITLHRTWINFITPWSIKKNHRTHFAHSQNLSKNLGTSYFAPNVTWQQNQ